MNFLMSKRKATLLLAFIAPVALASNCDVYLLGNYAYTKSIYRQEHIDKEEWFKYKNTAHSTPATYNLSDLCLDYSCPLTNLQKAELREFGDITAYERTVLLLRKGDKIVYGDKIFTLGKFIGAGNTTHIYQLEGTEHVIRIPFLSKELFNSFYQQSRLERIFSWPQRYIENMQRKKHAIEIIEYDPAFRYIVTEYIQGKETGFDFIKSIWLHDREAFIDDRIIYPPDTADIGLKGQDQMSEDEWQKWSLLIENMRDNKEVIDMYNGRVAFPLEKAGHYLWDELNQRWVVIDAE